jgi:hypothetical protein
MQPTSRPTNQPSSQPSCIPTSQPSTQPSSDPTSQPSCQPTNQPTSQPTSVPSINPEVKVCVVVSIEISYIPSNSEDIPIFRDVFTAAVADSLDLTGNKIEIAHNTPEGNSGSLCGVSSTQRKRNLNENIININSSIQLKSETIKPTSTPTSIPSSQPLLPTSIPSSNPTIPSSLPTSEPTTPSSMPSSEPTTCPSSHPSSLPTSIPSSLPTFLPSSIPSSLPTSPSNRPTSIPTLFPELSEDPVTISFAISDYATLADGDISDAMGNNGPADNFENMLYEKISTSITSGSFSKSLINSADRYGLVGTRLNSNALQSIDSLRSASVIIAARALVAGPTSSPTSNYPTSIPTRAPMTSRPTKEGDTNYPTSEPTISEPTGQPTIQPSGQPTRQPSSQPSSQPTSPTSMPTGVPTEFGLIPVNIEDSFYVAIGAASIVISGMLIGGIYLAYKIYKGKEKRRKKINKIAATSSGDFYIDMDDELIKNIGNKDDFLDGNSSYSSPERLIYSPNATLLYNSENGESKFDVDSIENKNKIKPVKLLFNSPKKDVRIKQIENQKLILQERIKNKSHSKSISKVDEISTKLNLLTEKSFTASNPKHVKKLNHSLIYYKPGMNNNPAIKYLVSGFLFETYNCRQVCVGKVIGEDIGKCFDKQYSHIRRFSVIQPSAYTLSKSSKEIFKSNFGYSWKSAIENGLIFNAIGASDLLSVNGDGLYKLWNHASMCGRVSCLGKGFYIAAMDRPVMHYDKKDKKENQAYIYVVNGFYGAMRNSYTKKNTVIEYIVIEWDVNLFKWYVSFYLF